MTALVWITIGLCAWLLAVASIVAFFSVAMRPMSLTACLDRDLARSV